MTDSAQPHYCMRLGVPQGPSLGPAQFISYTECTTTAFPSHSVQYHMFADDTQSYSYCHISETPLLVARLSCIDYLAKSYASLRLQLNPSKTEFIWFGSCTNLLKIPSSTGVGCVIPAGASPGQTKNEARGT